MKALTAKDVLSIVGCKFYRYDENENLDLLRVVGVQNIDTIKIRHNDGKEEKVNPAKILDNYRMLNSDGIITFSLVTVDAGNGQNIDDVIVCIHRKTDLDNGQAVPYAVCRQNVNDIFYEYMNPEPEVIYAGCSVSIDSIPENFNYQLLMACNDVIKSYGVNVYLDDQLEDILGMVKLKDFDKALQNLLDAHLKYCSPNQVIIPKPNKSYHGYCPNVKTLLLDNNFMYDFNTCFGITPLSIELSFTDDSQEHLDSECTLALSMIFRQNITNTYVVPFGHDIDKDSIGIDHMIVKTPSNKLYLIGYTVEGEFVESEESKALMNQMHGVAVQYSENKYK